MQRSEGRILVTHVGSIPRPPVLRDLLVRQDRGEPVDQRDLDRLAEQAVRHVVEQQLEAGVDVGNDGEQPRAGFSTYVARRMEGFGGESRRPLARDIAEHPDYRAMLDFRRRNAARVANAPQAVAEVRYTDLAEAERECDLFTRCADDATRQFTERFMTAVSPGTAATILLNAHYASHEQYIMALGRELRKEYELIHQRGFVLQLDCPDLAMERGRFFQDDSLDRFLQMVELHVDAINQAIAGIPRFAHPAARLLGELRRPPHSRRADGGDPAAALPREGRRALPAARQSAAPARVHGPQAPAAARRHAAPARRDRHDDQLRRASRRSSPIGSARPSTRSGDRERVIASTDCGFGTFAGSEMVAESVVWAKLRTLARGAELASARLWS